MHSKVPDSLVQEQISATNGIHYKDKENKLTDYPAYELPVGRAKDDSIMLDIGCGWGRWLVGGANKNYIPVGVDLQLKFCQGARGVLDHFEKKGYVVVGDLKDLPFKTDVFDLVWSFSVIQHTHRERLLSCLAAIQRILKQGGFTKLEFPNKRGIRNRFGPLKREAPHADDYDSWCVRYYTVREYRTMMEAEFGNFSFTNHSFLGIGVLKEDLKYVSARNKLPVLGSLLLSAFTHVVPGLKFISDSLYIKAVKAPTDAPGSGGAAITDFLRLHVSGKDNLNIVPLLQCPISMTSLTLSADRQQLVSEAGYAYPVADGIPILLKSEAKKAG